MNRITATAASLSLLLAAATAFAADTVATTDGTTAPERPKKKLICKLEKPVGSQMVKRICMTEEQADEQRQAARKALDRHSDQMRR